MREDLLKPSFIGVFGDGDIRWSRGALVELLGVEMLLDVLTNTLPQFRRAVGWGE
jgi:hypothetical protein